MKNKKLRGYTVYDSQRIYDLTSYNIKYLVLIFDKSIYNLDESKILCALLETAYSIFQQNMLWQQEILISMDLFER